MVGCDAEAADYLRYFCRQQGGDLRPYLSADVCKLIIGAAEYERVAPVLERQSINRVLALYSTKVVGGPGGLRQGRRARTGTPGGDQHLRSLSHQYACIIHRSAHSNGSSCPQALKFRGFSTIRMN